MTRFRIDLVDDPASCRTVEAIQREAWGMADRAVVPAEQVRAVVHNGGMLLLATVDGEAIGFCYGFVGLDGDEPILCSHMLAVRPSAQSAGIGQALKLAQREHAARRGFQRITWTFDPLQARNAYLNLHRLGARAARYFVDHYGPMDDEINRGIPTDRLLAEWPVRDEPRVRAAPPVDAPWVLPAAPGGGALLPAEPDLEALGAGRGLIAVPSSVEALRAADPDAPAAWRLALRTALSAAFDRGLTAVDLVRDAGDGYSAYLLERAPTSGGEAVGDVT